MIKVRAVLIVAFVAALVACDGNENKLVGEWQAVGDDNSRMELMSDDTAIYLFDGLSVEGTWEILDDSRMRKRAELFGTKYVETFSIEWRSDDEVALTDPDGDVEVFRRK